MGAARPFFIGRAKKGRKQFVWANRLGALCKRDRETVANFPPFRTGKSFHPFLPQLPLPSGLSVDRAPKRIKRGEEKRRGRKRCRSHLEIIPHLKRVATKEVTLPIGPAPLKTRLDSRAKVERLRLPNPSTVQTELKKAFPDFFFYEPAQPSYRVRKLSAHAPASIFFPPASFPPISPAGASGDGDYTLPPALFALFPCHVPSPPPYPLRQPLIKKVHALPSPSKAQDLNNRRRLEGDDAINHSKESVTLPPLPFLPHLLQSGRKGGEGKKRDYGP